MVGSQLETKTISNDTGNFPGVFFTLGRVFCKRIALRLAKR